MPGMTTLSITDTQMTNVNLASVTEHRRLCAWMITAVRHTTDVMCLRTSASDGVNAVASKSATLRVKLATTRSAVSNITLCTEPRGCARRPCTSITQVTCSSCSYVVVLGRKMQSNVIIVTQACCLRKTLASTTLLYIPCYDIFQSQVPRQGKDFVPVDVQQLTTRWAFKTICRIYNKRN